MELANAPISNQTDFEIWLILTFVFRWFLLCHTANPLICTAGYSIILTSPAVGDLPQY
jgi:hypothetical protein